MPALPVEIWLDIGSYLSTEDLCNFARVDEPTAAVSEKVLELRIRSFGNQEPSTLHECLRVKTQLIENILFYAGLVYERVERWDVVWEKTHYLMKDMLKLWQWHAYDLARSHSLATWPTYPHQCYGSKYLCGVCFYETRRLETLIFNEPSTVVDTWSIRYHFYEGGVKCYRDSGQQPAINLDAVNRYSTRETFPFVCCKALVM